VEDEVLSGWLFVCSNSHAVSFVPRKFMGSEPVFPWSLLEDQEKLEAFIKSFELKLPTPMRQFARFEIKHRKNSSRKLV
jgi:hypothetical protein